MRCQMDLWEGGKEMPGNCKLHQSAKVRLPSRNYSSANSCIPEVHCLKAWFGSKTKYFTTFLAGPVWNTLHCFGWQNYLSIPLRVIQCKCSEGTGWKWADLTCCQLAMLADTFAAKIRLWELHLSSSHRNFWSNLVGNLFEEVGR